MDQPGDETCRVDAVDGSDGVFELRLLGEFDEFSSARVNAVARSLVDRVGVRVRIDAGGVTFASSALVGALIRLHRTTTGGGGSIGFSAVSPTLARVLEVTNLGPMFDGGETD